MKRLALAFALTVGAASTALAADLPAPAPVPPPLYTPAVVYNWTGLYIGGNLGVGWDGGSFSDSIGNTLSLSNNPLLLGGGQVGLNYQFYNGFLIGVEADFDWLSNTVFAQGDRPSSGGDAPAPAAEAADAPAKAATPSSETGMMKATSATPPVGEPSLSLAALPQDLSPWGMFLHADTIVKAVMIGLAIASLVTWTVWVAKSIELFGARAAVRRGLRILANATTLAQAHEKLRSATGPVAQLMQAAANEIRVSANLRADGLKERIAWQSERIEMAAGRKISRGTGILATIGATAPFVGLFGTVWGIMDSFIGISKAHTTNLAVVAPGIAEALLATALGLVAAIPAVMIYNVLARSTAHYRALIGDASAQVMNLLSRDLDRAKLPLPHAAE